MKIRTTRNDVAIIAAVWAVMIFLGFLMRRFASPAAVIVYLATAVAIVAWLQLETMRRTSEQLSGLRKEAFDDFRQVEALLSIFATLKPEVPIPPTRDFSASPDLLSHIVSLIIERRPRFVVELGSGSSTVIIAYALQRFGGGRLLSIDHDAQFAERTRSMLELHGLTEVASVEHRPLTPVRINDADYLWYDIADLEIASTIDMMLIDGPPYHVHPLARYPALPLLSARFSDDVAIVLDDADRPEELRITSLWKKEFTAFSVERIETEKGALLLKRSSALSADRARGEIG